MLSNPHVGTDLEAPWEQGFTGGFLAADRDLSPPSPLTPEAQDAYSEGVQAGRLSIDGMRVPPTTPPEEPGTWEGFLFVGEHVGEHVLLEYAKHQAVKQLGAAAVGSSFGCRSQYLALTDPSHSLTKQRFGRFIG
jgi:hypothetical protein